MTQQTLATRSINTSSLTKRALIGGGIGLAVILVFIFGADNPPAEWGKYWMIRPLLVTPLAAAAGGVCTYFVDYLFGYQGGWRKVVATILNIIGFLISLWLGTVLGLAGTMWH